MSRITDWLHRAQCLAFDRFFRSNRVSNQVSLIVAALLPKIPWWRPQLQLEVLQLPTQSHAPRNGKKGVAGPGL